MTRENLLSTLAAAAVELCYTASFSTDLVASVKSGGLPLLWVEPLRVVALQGSRDCHITYRVTAKLLIRNDRMAQPTESIRTVLESDAIALFRRVGSAAAVEAVENFVCTPCNTPLTPMADAALKIEFDAKMFYCV